MVARIKLQLERRFVDLDFPDWLILGGVLLICIEQQAPSVVLTAGIREQLGLHAARLRGNLLGVDEALPGASSARVDNPQHQPLVANNFGQGGWHAH
eukprot:8914188-Pyramimonas_sp.AAC.1